MRLNPKLAEAKAILAQTEFRLHHLTAAQQRASEVIAQPMAELQAKITGYKVLLGVAAARGQWQKAKALLQQAQSTLPDTSQAALCLFAAEQAHEAGRDDLKIAWLTCAERLSPWSRAVAAARPRLMSSHASRVPRTEDGPSERPKETLRAPREPGRDPGSESKAEQLGAPESFSGWIVVVSGVVLIGGLGALLLARRYRRAG
jgi:hypothetical protein